MTAAQMITRHQQTCQECHSGRFCSICFALGGDTAPVSTVEGVETGGLRIRLPGWTFWLSLSIGCFLLAARPEGMIGLTISTAPFWAGAQVFNALTKGH